MMSNEEFFAGLDTAKAGLDQQASRSLEALLLSVRDLSRAIDPRSALPAMAEAIRLMLAGDRSVVVLRDATGFLHWSAFDRDGNPLPTPLPDVAERMKRLQNDAAFHLGHENHKLHFATLHLGRHGYLYVDGGERMRSSIEDAAMSVLGLVASQAQTLLDNAATLTQVSQLGHPGVCDRDYFVRRLREESSRSSRYVRPFSLVLVSFDNANKLDSTLGPARLAKLSELIASRLRDALREIDLIAGLGGLQFALLLPETPRKDSGLDALRTLAERLYTMLDGARLDTQHLVALEPRVCALAHASTQPIDADEMLREAQRLAADRNAHPVSCALR